MNRLNAIAARAMCVAALALFSISAGRAAEGTDSLHSVLQQNCVKCHGQYGPASGDVDLFQLKTTEDLAANPELIRDLARALDSGIMPPPTEPQLSAATRQSLVTQLRAMLHAATQARPDRPQTPIRRMTRFQYNNAVQDLFELDVEVFALPENIARDYGYFQPATGRMPNELKVGSRPLGKSQLIGRRLAGVAPFPQDLRAEHGYDNRGDHLTLSPLLLESFLRLSRSIVDSVDFHEETVGIWQEFFAAPTDPIDRRASVRQSLAHFLTRAFRGPVEDAVVDRYTQHALARLESGASYTDAMKSTASAALASPRFLYLYEQGGNADSAERLTDLELASRLSFFLWGSIPDETLIALAEQDKLHEPAVLDEQITRMLKDGRLKRFCDSFPAQWLQLDRIISSVPDRERFPDFYFAKFRASMHMMLEPLLVFETVLVEDRSILELLDSDFSYRSALLDFWYVDGTRPNKVPPTAIPFRRVPVADRRQGGVITNAAVMTMTSNPVRTQPITRGAWIAGVIFNDPPDPPPANVPPLPEDGQSEDLAHLTLREQFQRHRTDVACAGCHAKIDPLGFALENYGPTGVWRDRYDNGRNIDSAGVLFGRHEFTSVVEFKDAILAEREMFARAFSGHLLAFALGRELTVHDEPALDRIIAQTAERDFRLQQVIRQVIHSEPFLTKYNPVQPRKRTD